MFSSFKYRIVEFSLMTKRLITQRFFWNPTPDIKQWRFIIHTVKFEEQDDFESEK